MKKKHISMFMSGNSIFVGGIPGTSQSTTVRGWVKQHNKKVFLCPPTHVAARNLSVDGNQGITLRRFWNRYLKHGSVPKGGVLVMDEISLVHTRMWHYLMPLAGYAQIIAMENPEDQLGAVAESYGCSAREYGH